VTYRIRPERPLTEEVRGIARSQLKKAIDILYTERNGRHEAIHAARKRFKKLRGLYRLIRNEARDFYRTENARLRDAARSLSAVRDATALVEAMDRMIVANAAPDEHAVLLAIRQRLAARRDRIAAAETGLHASISAAIHACEEALDALETLDLPAKPKDVRKALAGGFATTYARAVDALGQARKSNAAEDWHDLRKRLKYHWMHSQLLDEAWPGGMRLRAAVAEAAGDDLGDDHDLAVLLALAENEPDLIGRADEIAILQTVVSARSETLRLRTADAVAGLLHDDRATVEKRMRVLWRSAAG
jgi:CHAD domain-containing protein